MNFCSYFSNPYIFFLLRIFHFMLLVVSRDNWHLYLNFIVNLFKEIFSDSILILITITNFFLFF